MSIDCDLDPRPTVAAPAAPRWSLPWTIATATSVAALLLLGALVARPAPVQAAAGRMSSRAASPQDPDVWEFGRGLATTTVSRDQAGRIVAVTYVVNPSGDADAWCRLIVGNERPVEVYATNGQPAVCTWTRGAANG